MVSRRHVFYIAGFDPIDGPAQHRRFRREVQKFDNLWCASTRVSSLTERLTGVSWQTETKGANWRTETTFELFDWQDLVRKEVARPEIANVAGGMVTFADFVLSGTAAKYFRAFWAYGMFFMAPFLNVIWFGLAAIGAGLLAAHLAVGSAWLTATIGIVGALLVFSILMLWLGRRWRVAQALADWNFARAFMYGRRPEMNGRLDAFAARLVEVVRAGGCEQILIIGHSLGATMAVVTLARALDRDGELARHGPQICLLTVGSTIPKLALHPAAKSLRADAARVAAEQGIAWTEYQARRDAISFYRFDPVTLTRKRNNDDGRNPYLRIVGIKDMMSAEAYQTNFFRIMRLHYQFVMGNDLRSQYDFFMFVCGPADFRKLSEAPDGALDLFDADGSLRAAAEQAV